MKDPNGKKRRGNVLTNLHQWQNHYLKPLRNCKRGEGWTEGTVWHQHLLAGLAFGFLQNVSYNLVVRALEPIILFWVEPVVHHLNGSGRPVSESVLTWNCSVLWAVQVLNRSEERDAHMSLSSYIIICISLFPVPSFGRHVNKHLAPTYTREHSIFSGSCSKAWGEEEGL